MPEKSLNHFITVFRVFLLHPKKFFRDYVTDKNQRPYFWVVLLMIIVIPVVMPVVIPKASVYGDITYIDQIIRKITKVYPVHNVTILWIVLWLASLLGSILGYWLLGWTGKLLIFCAGGRATAQQARTIFAYARAVGILPTSSGLYILNTVLQTWHVLSVYWIIFLLLVAFRILWAGIYQQVYTEYCGITVLTSAPKRRVIVWLLLFPFVFGIAVLLVPTLLFFLWTTIMS